MENNKPVTTQMTIGQVIEKHPEAAEVMLGYGLHCVGCSVNPYETIEQGALGHGMDEEQVENMMEDINLVVTKKPDYELNPAGITLSPRALDMLEVLQEQDQKQGYGLKVKSERINGELDYFLDLVQKPEEKDEVLEWQGMNIFIDKASLEMMKPSIIDFANTLQGEGFKIISLRKKGCCGGTGNCACKKGEEKKSGGCGGACGCK